MSIYLAATVLFLLFLISITWKKLKHTERIKRTAMTPVNKLQELLASHPRGYLFFIDEYTCVRTIARLPSIIRLLEKEKLSWMVVNAAERLDPQKGICPVCPYLQKFQVTSMPTLVYYENDSEKKRLVFKGDRINLKEIEQFLRAVTALKNVS